MKMIAVVLFTALGLAGCQSDSRSDRTINGGLLGAGAGALIGGVATGKAGGALAGAAIGGLGGALIGNATYDRHSYHDGRRCQYVDRYGNRRYGTCSYDRRRY